MRLRLLAAVPLAFALVMAPVALAPVSAAPSQITITAPDGGEGLGTIDIGFAAAPGDPYSFTIDSSSGTATEGTDYAGLHVTVIGDGTGSTVNYLPITVTDDANYEGPETFTLTLTPTSGSPSFAGGLTYTITINDNDAAPTLAIDDVTHVEGAGGDTTNFLFTVTKTGPTPLAATVTYQTADGTASSTEDYTATSGTLTFAPGVTTLTVLVVVPGDSTYEADEQFAVNLSAPVNATISDGQGTGTITDDDAANTPSLTISPEFRTVTEGPGGTSVVYTYEVYRLAPSGLDATFDITTADLGATKGVDYALVTPGPFTIPAGPGGGNVFFDIVVYGDDVYEGSERFDLAISNAVNATLSEVSVAGVTITDDDPRPPALGLTGSDPTAGLLLGALAVLAGIAMVAFSNLRRRTRAV